MRTPLFALAALLACGAGAAQTPLHTVFGDGISYQMGISVAIAGDVNADGFDDFIAGANHTPDLPASVGMARVYSGQDGSVLYTFYGDSDFDQFGWSVDAAGDVNADGRADVIVGAPQYYCGNCGSGYARVFSGLDGSILHEFVSPQTNAYVGWSVSGVGDVDLDGYADVAVSSYGSGQVRVFSGRDGSILHQFSYYQANSSFGYSVSGAGDVNGDQYPDLIIGAPSENVAEGTARVFSGKDSSLLYVFQGDSDNDGFGRSVDGAGDVDGDGYADVIVGAWGDGIGGINPGSARVYSGADGSLLHTFWGDDHYDLFGASVSGAGDLDGDGYDDLLVGAYQEYEPHLTSPPGYARAFSGADGSLLFTLTGVANFDYFGFAVDGVGDVDNDLVPDLIIGAPGENTVNGYNSGSARVFSGRCLVSPPTTYCTPKLSSSLCLPRTGHNNATPSLFSPAAFVITTTDLEQGKSALTFFGLNGPGNAPFQGGFLCVKPPLFRLPVKNTGGTGPCQGTLSYSLSDLLAQPTGGPSIGVGSRVWCQTWGRDPLDPFATSLSDGLEFTVCY